MLIIDECISHWVNEWMIVKDHFKTFPNKTELGFLHSTQWCATEDSTQFSVLNLSSLAAV